MAKTILLVDGTNCFIRCFAAIPAINSQGQSFGGVKGFLFSLKSYCTKCKPDQIMIVWDGKGGSKRRRSLQEDYKGNRKPTRLKRTYEYELDNVKENKIYQRIRLNEYLSDLPVKQIAIEDIEADDVISYLCLYFSEDRKIIVSTDRDYYQLLNKDTIIYSPTKKVFITPLECFKEFGIYPINFALAKAIVGDKSDNIKGVGGVGFKKLLKFFPFFAQKEKIELEQILAHSKNGGEKYSCFTNNESIIITNLKIVQLTEPIISLNSITKIKSFLESKLNFNATSFRVKLLQDGINDVSADFFEPFKILHYINEV